MAKKEKLSKAKGGARWTVLGAGSILPRRGYGCSGYALEPTPGGPVTLFDCGPGTLRSMAEAGLELSALTRIVISHFHLDHCLDLFALGFARTNPAFDAPPLELIGPVGLQHYIEGAAAALGNSPARGFLGVRFLEVEPSGKIASREFEDYKLSTVATYHTLQALAWRADLAGGGSVTYSGDTGEEPMVGTLAQKSGFFFCECSFPEELGQPNHLTPAGAGRLAAHADCATLVLTHFYPSCDPERARVEAAKFFKGEILLAQDRSVFELAGDRTGEGCS
ncbi:MAG: MBL fold metallo-hydrolase [bacterium]|jgi:ribonuclease BN (tRNA processing enzyme)|nr:MBL fold metallo-hydrolase [Planctomycetota bacterium]HIL51133.1 MBL fold metallo-hydrolase [Planctomycetota bacterium]